MTTIESIKMIHSIICVGARLGAIRRKLEFHFNIMLSLIGNMRFAESMKLQHLHYSYSSMPSSFPNS